MFSNNKKDYVPPPQNYQGPQPAHVKRPSTASAPSIISADLTVQGTITSAGDIQIDGTVEGDIRAGGLVIGDKAIIHGQIFGNEVTVRGRVEGSIRAHKVLLCASSHVEGDIIHAAFAVETGAFFEGNCRHSDNPLEESASKARKAAAPSPEGIAADTHKANGNGSATYAPAV
jgi:cytoskeletal protein CcmA (bactofilin family)